MSEQQQPLRPITIAILAMGGEGGGVLSDWIAAVAGGQGWTAQTTSVAGVAQRTGATVYYVELFPPFTGTGARSEPVMSTMPTPGEVDLLVASELMEAGRAVERGFVTPDRTILVASTNRVYSVAEKSGVGDARVDSDALLAGAQVAARRLIADDFMALATQAGSVISASLFGAVAGSQALAFPRESYEDAIRASGKGVDASLRAFAAGFAAAEAVVASESAPKVDAAPAGRAVPITIGKRWKDPETAKAKQVREQEELAQQDPGRLVGPDLQALAARIGRDFPAAARFMLLKGIERAAVYQDVAYAERYLDRVASVAALDPDPDGKAELTTEAARHIALWMCYQDTIHVALQKTRSARMAGIRTEARAGEAEQVVMHEYLHPQLEEIADTAPRAIGRWMMRSKVLPRIIGPLTRDGITVNTASASGFLTLSLLARLRPIRPHSLRFDHEQREIDAFLDVVRREARTDPALALSLVRCVRVLKGYGETWARGEKAFATLLAQVPVLSGRTDAAARLDALLAVALSDDEEGTQLAARVASSPSA